MGRQRVIAVLGGNAFASAGAELTMAGQFRFARQALALLSPFFDPAIDLLIRVEEALGKAYALPLSVCVAESEGELGYVLLFEAAEACRLIAGPLHGVGPTGLRRIGSAYDGYVGG